ncbi:ATP-binding protein [Curtobacterium flaccumfaciens pv. flaccumfaciens]|uniref:ATP-binding protein n=1 Tax=Curtobacterium flaccumfaciens TaxID=2035 RepID=UPI001BCFD2AD|nr:ATP-binding protein [Curtobacterium flaccumfaciens]QVG65539.1 ATP-binding protein [Curtobacterium flaccumfaciens pv. flaccumfaciens]
MTGLLQTDDIFELHDALMSLPARPTTIDREEWAKRSNADRLNYNEKRLNYIGADFILMTPQLVRAMETVALIQRRNRWRRYGRQTIVLSGPSGSGKSTALTMVAAIEAARAEQERPDRPVSVLGVEAPPTATPKALLESILEQIRIQPPRRATISELVRLVVDNLNRLDITLVLVDEIGHLASRRQTSVDAARTLKSLTNQVRATFVYAGVNVDKSVLMNGADGEQLARRSIFEPFAPMSTGSDDGKREWRSVIRAFERDLQLLDHSVSTLPALADQLFDRTGGSIGTLRNILTDCAIDLIEAHSAALRSGRAGDFEERIDWDRLRAARIDKKATMIGGWKAAA